MKIFSKAVVNLWIEIEAKVFIIQIKISHFIHNRQLQEETIPMRNFIRRLKRTLFRVNCQLSEYGFKERMNRRYIF